ncbi:MAG: response regulator, partial [Bacteroidetes bacterium]|nr:response regulator [Bacteroidota bacterium]
MRTIFIVEDSPTQAVKLEYLLNEKGYRVVIAESTEVALSKLNSLLPDLIISDILMPGKDGYSLCREIKNNQEFKHIPVILLTTLSESENILKAIEVGADYYFPKPYDEEYLLSKVESILLWSSPAIDGKEPDFL